jgi:hypothetical protein
MVGYKFLAKGAIGPISGYAWPAPRGVEPGPWIEVDGPLALCSRGVHLCAPTDLAHWLHDELWHVESDGDPIQGIDCFIVRRARLVRRVDVWSHEGSARFARSCVDHATSMMGAASNEHARGVLEDARSAAADGYFAASAFCAALAVAKSGRADEGESAYRRERRWQSEWIMREIVAA